MAKAEDAKELFRQIEALRGIDILYNNAGVISQSQNLSFSNDNYFDTAAYEININYLAVIRLNNLFMDMLKSILPRY